MKDDSPAIILLAYGEMGRHALAALDGRYRVCTVFLPAPSDRTDAEAATAKYAAGCGVPITTGYNLAAAVRALRPVAVVCCSFSRIIPAETLALCPHWLNVHHGSLPQYRGRAGFNWAIINGLASLDVCFHQIVPALDAGPVWVREPVEIGERYIGEVYELVNAIVASRLPAAVDMMLTGQKPAPQIGTPTYTCTRLPEDGLIDWSQLADRILRLVRALSVPFPGAFTYLDGWPMYVWRARPGYRRYDGTVPGRVGRILPGEDVEVCCGGLDSILLTDCEVQEWHGRPEAHISSTSVTLGRPRSPLIGRG